MALPEAEKRWKEKQQLLPECRVARRDSSSTLSDKNMGFVA